MIARVPLGVSLTVFVALAALPWLAGDYWTGQFTRSLLYGLLALSLALVWGRGGMLCLGQGMFFGTGGYVMALLTMGKLGPGLADAWLALIVAAASAAALAAIVGVFVFWGASISGPYFAIVTLAIAVVLEQSIRGNYGLGGDNGLVGVPPLPLGTSAFDATPPYFFVLVVVAAAYFALDATLSRRIGLVLDALRVNPNRLAYLGYSLFCWRIATFAAGGALAGLAGALFVAIDGFASPTLIGFGLSAEALIWVALGGRTVLMAALLAAIGVRHGEALLAASLGDWWLLALGSVFVLVAVSAPTGLLAAPLLWLGARVRR